MTRRPTAATSHRATKAPARPCSPVAVGRRRPAARTRRATALVVAVAVLAALAASHAADLLIVAPSEANYRVREQLAGVSFPNDAVGTTRAVSGRIGLLDGGHAAEGSRVTVELTDLASDQPRRDNFVRSNTLQTARFPIATFVPTSVEGLALPLPREGRAEVTILGDLTVRGVTRAVVWRGIATFDGDAARLEAATTFTFAEFELTKPRVASVLSVADEITLEVRLSLRAAD